MDDAEIARRIDDLTEEQRDELYRLCAARRGQPGGNTPVFEEVSAAIAEVLHDKELVRLLGTTQAAARGDVYLYWLDHVVET